MLRNNISVVCFDVFVLQVHSSLAQSDMEVPGQAANHIVLRLARDTSTKSTDSWQVLSIANHNAFCEFDQMIRAAKFKKVLRQKRRSSVTIHKPGNTAKLRNKRTGRQKRQTLTKTAAVLNNVTVSDRGVSNDIESQAIRRKKSKHANASAVDCCNFCVSTIAQKHQTVTRRSRSAQLLHKDGHPLKENFIEASDSGSVLTADNIVNTVTDAAVVTVDHFDNVCASERSVVSETLLTQDDSHHHVDSCQELNMCNGLFGLSADSVKIRRRRRRKVVLKSKSVKRRHRVAERLSVAKDEKHESEADKTVDSKPVAKTEALNTDVIGSSIVVSRRSRPVKNTRLMNNCYVFSLPVKTRRRRKTAGKQPASESALNSTTEHSEAGNSQLESIDNVANHSTAIDDDKLNCHVPVPESAETSSTEKRSCFAVECTDPSSASIDEFNEDPAQRSISGNTCVHKQNADLLNGASDSTHIMHEETDTKLTEVKETGILAAADCKHNLHSCNTTADKDILIAVDTSPPLSCMHSDVKDDFTDNHQLSCPSENVCCAVDQSNKNGDITLAQSAETNTKSSPSGTVTGDHCEADDTSDATVIQRKDEKMHDVSAKYSDGLSCIPGTNETTPINVDCHVLTTDAGNTEGDKLGSDCQSDCLLPDSAADINVTTADIIVVGTDVHDTVANSSAVMVDLSSVDAEVQKLHTDDAVKYVSSSNADDNDIHLPSESFSAVTDETVSSLTTDKHGNITGITSTCLLVPEADSVTACEVELGKSVSDSDAVSHAVSASSCSVTSSASCNLCSDVVTNTNTDSSDIVSPSVCPPALSSSSTSEFGLSLRTATSSPHHHHHRRHHHRRNTHRYHRTRRKSDNENIDEDVSRNSAGSSAELLNGRTCPEEKCEKLIVNDCLTDSVCRVRRKSSGSDTLEEICPDVATGSGRAVRKRSQDTSSRLSSFLLLIIVVISK